MLVEALPDTLELLLRASMEGLSLAGERAKNEASFATLSSSNGRSNGGGGGVSELELARAVMSDSVYLAQLAPECFHEVVARVARKAEPERYALLFPLHRVSGDHHLGQEEEEGRPPATKVMGEKMSSRRTGGGGGVGARWGRWVHPTHLFHECISAGKLTTAAWYLPLVRDDVAYDAAQR